jgi:hypothetical protein
MEARQIGNQPEKRPIRLKAGNWGRPETGKRGFSDRLAAVCRRPERALFLPAGPYWETARTSSASTHSSSNTPAWLKGLLLGQGLYYLPRWLWHLASQLLLPHSPWSWVYALLG